MRDYNLKALYPYKKVLSSSQFLCYLRDPKKFYVEYAVGLPRNEGPALILGKAFSEAYADPQFDLQNFADERKLPKAQVARLLAALPLLARQGSPEHEILAPLGKWKLRATLDDYNKDRYEIIENKTGSRIWTQERVNFDNQLTFQALAHWLFFKVPPSRITVNWVPTIKSDHIVHRFRTTRSIGKLKQFKVLVETVIEHIEAGNFSHSILS